MVVLYFCKDSYCTLNTTCHFQARYKANWKNTIIHAHFIHLWTHWKGLHTGKALEYNYLGRCCNICRNCSTNGDWSDRYMKHVRIKQINLFTSKVKFFLKFLIFLQIQIHLLSIFCLFCERYVMIQLTEKYNVILKYDWQVLKLFC